MREEVGRKSERKDGPDREGEGKEWASAHSRSPTHIHTYNHKICMYLYVFSL